MKKTLIAATLVMALMLGVTTTAFAVTGEGSVVFDETTAPEVVDPKDPTPPETIDPEYVNWDIESSDIYFGDHGMFSSQKIWDSEEKVTGDGLDKLGLLINNANTLKNWKIQMKIDEFKVGAVTSIASFDLDLTAGTIHKSTGSNVTVNSTIALAPGLTADVATGSGAATAGTNFTGKLTIPGNGVAVKGTSQAVITWIATGGTP